GNSNLVGCQCQTFLDPFWRGETTAMENAGSQRLGFLIVMWAGHAFLANACSGKLAVKSRMRSSAAEAAPLTATAANNADTIRNSRLFPVFRAAMAITS